ncbi:MAG TPA: TonB-dependent receptor [Bryobacteraceae bacterium]|nr:TonB-dependent receptor [Bryobacteraceae bacterium]
MVRIAAAFLFLQTLAFAQLSTAELAGRVTDQSGSVVAGARVTLRNTATGVERSTESNEQGYYSFPAVQPGPYTVSAAKEGFAGMTREGLELQVDQRARLDFDLKVGQVTDSVTVRAAAVEVRTASGELGSVMQEAQVVDLPLNGRNFTQLLLLTPGASPISVGQNRSGGNASPTVGAFTYPSINGQSNRSLLFFTDGVANTNTFMTSYSVPPIVDSIQEFKLQSHNDQGEVGMAAGGVVNVATKSGSNVFHGSAWEFMRNNIFDARNTFRTGVTALRQNMFGASLGGPIRRNHTFFFVAYQGFTNRTPANTLYRVPTPANLQGDLSDWPRAIYDPFSTRPDPNTAGAFIRDVFPRNQIPGARIDQGWVAFAKATLPAPIPTGVGDRNQLDLTPAKVNQNEYTGRVDHTFSERDQVWFRWSGLIDSISSGGGRQTLRSATDLTPMNLGASWVHTFGPTRLLQFQFGRSFSDTEGGNSFINGGEALASAVGFDQTFCCSFHSGRKLVPNVNVPQFFAGGESYNAGRPSDVWQFRLNYSLVRGNHEFRFGGEFNKLGFTTITNDHNVDFDPSSTGDPRNLGATGSPLASWLLNVPLGAARRDFNKHTRFGGVMGFYAQDSWRATPRLTVNLALRLDYTMIPPLGRKEDGTVYMGNLDMLSGTYWVLAVPGSCVALKAAPCVPTADGRLPDHVQLAPDGELQHDYGANWQPRFGIAYKLSDKTALRGSYGVFFDNFAGVLQSAQNLGHTWPDIGRRLSSGFNLPTAANPTPTILGKNPFPLAGLPNPTPFVDGAFFNDPNFKNLYSMQWNLGIERAIGTDAVASVNYVGSGSRRLPIGGFFNVASTPGPGSAAARRPFPYINPTNFDRSWGRSSYNALQAQLRRRFTRGFTVLVNYTWSKSIDTGCDGFYGVEGCAIQDPYHFNNDRSVTGTDLTHVFNASWTWEIPLRAANRGLNMLVHGWQLNGIATFFSGPPYTVVINGDIANTGNQSGYMRPNLVGNPNAVNSTTARWINTAAFAAPAQFTFGTAGRNILRADGAHNFDLSVFRSFPIPLREGMRIEFRGEAFNAFNTPRYSAPTANMSNSNFGQVLSTANAERQFQFGLKILF